MRTKMKRALGALLCCMLMLALMPVTAFAETTATPNWGGAERKMIRG